MHYIFYFISLIAILWEIYKLNETTKYLNFTKDINKKIKGNPSSRELMFTFLMLGYMFWTFVGLFTSQWALFLLMWAFSLLPKFKMKILLKIDSILSIALLLLILLNKYHLHIDFKKLILDWMI